MSNYVLNPITPRPVNVEMSATGGIIVRVGCQEFAFATLNTAMEAIRDYFQHPMDWEARWVYLDRLRDMYLAARIEFTYEDPEGHPTKEAADLLQAYGRYRSNGDFDGLRKAMDAFEKARTGETYVGRQLRGMRRENPVLGPAVAMAPEPPMPGPDEDGGEE